MQSNKYAVSKEARGAVERSQYEISSVSPCHLSPHYQLLFNLLLNQFLFLRLSDLQIEGFFSLRGR